MKELQKEKQIIKKKTPYFIRTSGITKVRLMGTGWRRPKGIQNKMRLQEHGKRAIVKTGYGTPALLRGMGRDGKTTILVSNVADLKKVGKNQKAIITSQVGLKKKIQIVEEAKKLKVEIANFNDADKVISEKVELINAKRKEQETKKDARSKKKDAIEKAKQKEEKKEKVSDEDQKKEEKKKKDDVMLHKN